MVAPALRLLSAAALAAVLLALAACETVQFGPEPAVPPSDTAKAEATLLFANKRETDPGPLVLLLYSATAQILENAAPVREFPEVAFDMSVSLKLAPGKYKLAYRMESGDLRPMPPSGDEGLDSDWPVATFASGRTYHLLIETDEGNNTVWRTDIPVSATR